MLAAHQVAAGIVRPTGEHARTLQHLLRDAPARQVVEIPERSQHQRRERTLLAQELAAGGRERPGQHGREAGRARNDEKLEAAFVHPPAAGPGEQETEPEGKPDRKRRKPSPP